MNAQRWLERLWDAAESLAHFPHRGAFAAENAFVAHEVRQLVVGHHLLLFTIDEKRQTVWVIGLRYGRRLPDAEKTPDPNS